MDQENRPIATIHKLNYGEDSSLIVYLKQCKLIALLQKMATTTEHFTASKIMIQGGDPTEQVCVNPLRESFEDEFSEDNIRGALLWPMLETNARFGKHY